MRQRNPKILALVVTLVGILIVLPVMLVVIVRISEARWKAAHPVQTVTPNVTGRDRLTAEGAVRHAQLVPQVTFTEIQDKCWQDRPLPDTVIDQDPKPITPVPVGSDVKLTIGVEKNASALSYNHRCCQN